MAQRFFQGLRKGRSVMDSLPPPGDLIQQLDAGFTICGRKLPSDDDPQHDGLGWRLQGYTEALSSLFCESSPGSATDASSLLQRDLLEVADWQSIGDLPTGAAPAERKRATALAAAFGLRCIDSFVELLQSGAPALALVLEWDRLCDAHRVRSQIN